MKSAELADAFKAELDPDRVPRNAITLEVMAYLDHHVSAYVEQARTVVGVTRPILLCSYFSIGTSSAPLAESGPSPPLSTHCGRPSISKAAVPQEDHRGSVQ